MGDDLHEQTLFRTHNDPGCLLLVKYGVG